jgi:hypothetical protein
MAGDHIPKKVKSTNHKNTTVGHSYKVEAASELIFRQWLLQEKWLPRAEKPDFFIDFSIEVVREGEPTSEIFRAQLKGRSLSRRERNERKERFETKHLLYYLSCDQPVFLFLLDHETREGYWVFAQQYIREHWTEDQLNSQGTVTVEFRPLDNLHGLNRFYRALQKALEYVRELSPGTPSAAIKAVKAEFEKLDSRFQVTVTADEHRANIEVRPKDPNTMTLFSLSPNIDDQTRFNFVERGMPLQIPATEISAPNFPILSKILKKAGSQEITIRSAASFPGAIQIFVSSHTLQLDGEWLLAPKRLEFEGALKDSPLKAFLEVDADDTGKFGHPKVRFSVNPHRWSGQPLRSLAYFEPLSLLFGEENTRMRCLIRGNSFMDATANKLDFEGAERAANMLRWIGHCRRVATRFGTNPPFPTEENFPMLEADDLVLLGRLISGGYEQNFENDEATAVIHWRDDEAPKVGAPLNLNTTGQFRETDFLGSKLKVGPLIYRLSNLVITDVEHVQGTIYKLKARGGPSSRLRIELC